MATAGHTRADRVVPRALFALVKPLQAFFRLEAASGVLLLAAAVVAVAWANSRWSGGLDRFVHAPVTLGLGRFVLRWTVHQWVNEGLMTLFFLVVGLEIKRELLRGELRSLSRALLPLAAAFGGMLVPALAYLGVAGATPARAGWGIPMATDIAFALGCLSLVRSRVPASLFVFVMSLAIFDDLGAIVVIGLFYGHGVSWPALAVAGGLAGALFALGRTGTRSVWPYALLGFALWVATLRSGLHSTLAGVVLGLAIPARAPRPAGDVLHELDEALDSLRQHQDADAPDSGVLADIERHLEEMQAPLDRVLAALHGPVAFGIVPLFALVNAGVRVVGSHGAATSPAAVGVALGLVLGKPLGVFGVTWIAVRARLAPRPTDATWAQVFGVSLLTGIGFTMSLFIDELAFTGQPALAEGAKLGVLAGSTASAVLGLVALRVSGQRASTAPAR